MMNSSGRTLWQVNAAYEIIGDPLCGRDGRVFVRGKEALSCYGIKGVRRWTLTTPPQKTSVPLTAFEDGSLLVFLIQTAAGATRALRVSPFGKIVDELSFEGIVTGAVSSESGVIVTLSDGSVKLYSAAGGEVSCVWTYKAAPRQRMVLSGGGAAAVISDGRVAYLNERSGTVISDFATRITLAVTATHTEQGLVLLSRTGAVCYTPDGEVYWDVNFDLKKRPAFVFPSDDGVLHFCMGNWAIEAYKIKEGVAGRPAARAPAEVLPYEYTKTYETGPDFQIPIDETLKRAMNASFKSGDFPEHEEMWNTLISRELQNMYETYSYTSRNTSHPYFTADITYCDDVLALAAENGVYLGLISDLMRETSNKTLLLSLAHAAGVAAFDPGGKYLDALLFIVRSRAGRNDERLLREAADAVFKICVFMGRDMFFTKGSLALNAMLEEDFTDSSRRYALSVMQDLLNEEW